MPRYSDHRISEEPAMEQGHSSPSGNLGHDAEILHQEIHLLKTELTSLRRDMKAVQGEMASVLAQRSGLPHVPVVSDCVQCQAGSGGLSSTSEDSLYSALACTHYESAGNETETEPEHWAVAILFALLGAGRGHQIVRICLRVVFASVWIVIMMLLCWDLVRVGLDPGLCAGFGMILYWIATMIHWVYALILRPQRSLLGVEGKLIATIVGVYLLLFVAAAAFTENFHTNLNDTPQGWLLICVVVVMQAAPHLATALLFQADSADAIASLCQVTRGPANYVFSIHSVRLLERRWRTMLRLHLVLEGVGQGLIFLDVFYYSQHLLWDNFVSFDFFCGAPLCLMLCQISPLVAYNEAVASTHLLVDDFPTAQRLKREPLEFRVLLWIMSKRSFQALLGTVVASVVGFVVRVMVTVA